LIDRRAGKDADDMGMSTGGLLMSVPMVALLTWAAAVDLRIRRIPNWLTVAMMLSGFAQSLTWAHTVTPGQSALGFLTGFGLTLLFFWLGAMGGGDVKLLAAVGAWLGPWPTIVVFGIEAVLGMVFVLAHAACTGRLTRLFQNSTVIALNYVAAADAAALEQAADTGRACSSSSRLPYAVPVLLAVLLVLARA
jgi:prepilin peptidase CpaA